MKEFLIKLLTLGVNSPERNGIAMECINSAKDEYIKLAYKAALDNASNKKIIYLLGGNNPVTCPFN